MVITLSTEAANGKLLYDNNMELDLIRKTITYQTYISFCHNYLLSRHKHYPCPAVVIIFQTLKPDHKLATQ